MKIKNIEYPSNKKFGLFFSIVFLLIAWFLFEGSLNLYIYVCIGISTLFFLATIICPNILLPLNKAWMAFGLILGSIISPIILGIIFFIIITPIAILGRMFGRNELKLNYKNNKSNWVTKRIKIRYKDAFKNQF